MQFTAGRNDAAVAVACAAGGIPGSPVVPVRAAMLVQAKDDAVRFTGSDGDVTFTATCQAQVARHGEVLVPGRLFSEVVRSLPGDGTLSLSVDGPHAVLECGRSRFSFRVVEGFYPPPPDLALDDCGTVDGEQFTAALRKVIPAAAKADAIPAYTAVRLEAGDVLDVVATDRYRLARVICPWTPLHWDAPAALVPAWAAERFARGISGQQVGVGWDERVCTLRAGDFTVTTRLMTGTFPDWRKLLSAEPSAVTVDPEILEGSLRRALLASENNSPVQLSLGNGALDVEASGSSGSLLDTMPVDYDGQFSALFGIGNLIDGLAGCGEECKIGFTGPLRPLFLYSGTFTYLILPRRKV